MSLHALIVPAYSNMLRNLSAELAKAVSWAKEHGMSEQELLGASLVPDMFPLSTQINFSAHQAREVIARLKGDEVPAPPEETTLPALEALLGDTIAQIEAVSPADIDRASDKTIRLDLPNGMVFEMTGFEFVRDWAQAQFYFHRITAYAIMRQLGVPLGKADYVAHAIRYLQTPG